MMSLLSLHDGLRFCVATRQFYFESGGRAAAPFFLLLAQKKEDKEKGTLLTRPSAPLCFSPTAARKELGAMRLKHLFALSAPGCDARRVRREPGVGFSWVTDDSFVVVARERKRPWQSQSKRSPRIASQGS
jgi:hypothetical protein